MTGPASAPAVELPLLVREFVPIYEALYARYGITPLQADDMDVALVGALLQPREDTKPGRASQKDINLQRVRAARGEADKPEWKANNSESEDIMRVLGSV